MAQVHAMGHDKRGNTVYKRNADGEEILVPSEPRQGKVLERSATGDASVRSLPRQRVVDDDTPPIASDFLQWKASAVLGW